ncbi:Enterobactin exporter EntS [Streptomyces afghaniensis]
MIPAPVGVASIQEAASGHEREHGKRAGSGAGDLAAARLAALGHGHPPRRRPAYRRLWSSTIVTAVGSQLTAVAVPKQIYDITGSSAWVGAASLAGLVPLIVFALWGGAIADSMDRRKLLLITNSGIAVTSLLFWLQAFTGLESVAALMVLLAVQQAFWGLNAPARNASIARLVPEDELPAANALGSTVMQTGQVAGPLLAGALIPVIGLPELYLIDAVALCVTVWAVYRLPSLPPLAGTAARRAGVKEIAAGFRYISGHTVLLLSFLADIIAMVLGMPRALFPQLAAQTYAPYGEGVALGLLFAAIPIGAVLGGSSPAPSPGPAGTAGWSSGRSSSGVRPSRASG